MKNKALTITLIALVALTLIGVVVLVLVMQMNKGNGEPKEPSIDQVLEQSVDIEEITTNLADGKGFIRLELKIQTDNKKAADELEKREFQVRNIVIQETSDMTAADFEGKAGKQAFEESIRAQINPLMQEGEVTKVYIVSYVIQ